jgi:hypothetical protein
MLERPPRKPPAPPPSIRRAELRRERHRRHRARLKRGEVVVPVTIGPTELDWLIRIRWVSEGEADAGDGRVIGEAITRGLAASARG